MMMIRTNHLKPPPRVSLQDNNNNKQYTSISKKDIEFEALVQAEMQKIENNLKNELKANKNSNNNNNNSNNDNDIEIFMPTTNNYDIDNHKVIDNNNYHYITNNIHTRPNTEWDGLKPTTSETNIIPIKVTYDDKSRPQTE